MNSNMPNIPDDTIDWNQVSLQLSEDEVHHFKDKLNWSLISKHRKLSEEFIKKHLVFLNISLLCQYQELSENFMNSISDLLDYTAISRHQKLSETFLERYYEKLDKTLISEYQKLSNEFIKKHYKDLNLKLVILHQKLAESTIEYLLQNSPELFTANVWKLVISQQKLSPDFIEKHKNQFSLCDVVKYQKLPDSFINNNYQRLIVEVLVEICIHLSKR